MNQKVKNLIQKLGEAIHETVSESEDIAVVVKNIREQGFDVLLMLEATIGLNEVKVLRRPLESAEPPAVTAVRPSCPQTQNQPHRDRLAFLFGHAPCFVHPKGIRSKRTSL